jgi:DNA-binding NarL/FixJ family response regulator
MGVISDSDLIQFLADGYRIVEIAKQTNINKRTLESRLAIIKDRSLCKTYGQVIAVYLRKKLIK